jgi:HSP20 family protein
LWYDSYVAFARWDPIRDLLAIHQRLDRFAPGQGGWMPPVDLFETPDAYVVTAELPGLNRDDLQIDFRDGRLTLSGVRREVGGGCERYQRMERGHGTFSRTFQLPIPIDSEDISADLRDGVLRVVCPKSAAAFRRIHIA